MHENLCALLRALEEQLLQPATRANPEAIAVFLADDFCEFGSSGHIYTKPQILAELATEPIRLITLDRFSCQMASPDVALVTYHSYSATGYGRPKEALRSSLWVLREGRWQMLFHQGTRIPA